MRDEREDNESREEVRKVQLTGKSTFIVSLPKKWATRIGLKAGSQLVVSRQSAASLVLTPRELVTPPAPREADIPVCHKDDPNAVARRIIALYLVGYNSIVIRTRGERITSLQRNFIKDLTRKKLFGTEIVSDSSKEMKLQVLLSYPELSVEDALRRMCLIATSMHEDALQALKDPKGGLAQDVIALDDEVDRFSLYIIRQLKAAVQSERTLRDIGFSNQTECLGYRVIVKSVERIADHAVKIAEAALSLSHGMDASVVRRILEMSSFAKSAFDDSTRSLHKKDYLLADNVVARAERMGTMENVTMKAIAGKVRVTEMASLRMIMESIRRTAEYASDIGEVVLNLNVAPA